MWWGTLRPGCVLLAPSKGAAPGPGSAWKRRVLREPLPPLPHPPPQSRPQGPQGPGRRGGGRDRRGRAARSPGPLQAERVRAPRAGDGVSPRARAGSPLPPPCARPGAWRGDGALRRGRGVRGEGASATPCPPAPCPPPLEAASGDPGGAAGGGEAAGGGRRVGEARAPRSARTRVSCGRGRSARPRGGAPHAPIAATAGPGAPVTGRPRGRASRALPCLISGAPAGAGQSAPWLCARRRRCCCSRCCSCCGRRSGRR